MLIWNISAGGILLWQMRDWKKNKDNLEAIVILHNNLHPPPVNVNLLKIKLNTSSTTL